MNYFALRLSGEAVQLAAVEKKNDKLELAILQEYRGLGSAATSPLTLSNLPAAAAKALTTIGKNYPRVVVNIPEEVVISRVVNLPPMKDAEIASALHYEAETFIPYPVTKAQMDYQVLQDRKDKGKTILVVATQKSYLDALIDLLTNLRLVPLAIENYSIALTRVFATEPTTATAIVDIGAMQTTVVISYQRAPYLSHFSSLGGDTLTRAVSVVLGMSLEKAEAYKTTYGLKAGQWKNKIRQALLPVVQQLVVETRKSILAFEGVWKQKVKVLTLSGKGSLVPGLADELVSELGVEVQWGDPLAGLTLNPSLASQQHWEEKKLEFSGVIGSALRLWK